MAFCDPVQLPLKIRRQIKFGPYKLYCQDANSDAIDLTGFSVMGLARPELESPNILDLDPQITTPATGEITIELADTETAQLVLGDYNYDIVLENASNERLPPIVAGTLRVIDVNSRE